MKNRTAALAALALAISGVSIGCQSATDSSRGDRVDRIGLDPRDTSDLDSTQNVAGARTGVGQGGVPREDSTGLINTEAQTEVGSTPAAGTMTRDETDARQRSIDSTRLDQDVAGGGVPPGTSAGNRAGTPSGSQNTDSTAQQRDNAAADRNDTRVIDLDDDDNDDDAVGAGVRIEARPAHGTADDRMNNNNANPRAQQPAQRPTGADRTEQNRTGTGQDRANPGGSTTRPSN